MEQVEIIYELSQDGRSSAESRSLADDFGDDKTAEELFPVVIAAEPR